MGMFKVGDKVTVRRDLVAVGDGAKVRYYNLDAETLNKTDVSDIAISDMLDNCGRECVITSTTANGKYKLKGSDNFWTDEMFELAEYMPNTFRMWETKTFA